MLEPGRSEAYQHHISGSALLVKRLTPARFKTDYEKMLFHAHIGPIFTEALMKNERCYLEQPEWMRLYESTIQDDTAPRLTDRSGVVVRIRMQILKVCSTLVDATQAINPGPENTTNNQEASPPRSKPAKTNPPSSKRSKSTNQTSSSPPCPPPLSPNSLSVAKSTAPPWSPSAFTSAS
jgi:hypothetical protein